MQSIALPSRSRSRLRALFEVILKACIRLDGMIPSMGLAQPEVLRREPPPGARKLVVGGKVIIIPTENKP